MKMINIYPEYCKEVYYVSKDNIVSILSDALNYPMLTDSTYNVIITLSDGKTFEMKFNEKKSAICHMYDLVNLINSED